ncbi:Crinkler (CRN) family protein [Phytophthora cinnamomi]|uniref:Crinkler (CRN) family protein n=1 Tax=Phytophthora cinnamomi TaxID=4785 RepID=UPI002A32DE18|nr:Crinkler (CRN) family protein [Phytophthora cinnamomi]KAJ8548463.1 hypothetical protein ON010_g11211 [Phytophthora cinnamomi]
MVGAPIYCGVVGVTGDDFLEEIDENKSVVHLKKAVNEEQKYPFPSFKLELFVVRKDGGSRVAVNDDENNLDLIDDMKQLEDIHA